jgi:hypothetical protein
MSYVYSAQNRLVTPETYMYSEFRGLPFLIEYLQSRACVVEENWDCRAGAGDDCALASLAAPVLQVRLEALETGCGRALQVFLDSSPAGKLQRTRSLCAELTAASAYVESQTTATSTDTVELLLGLISIQLTGKVNDCVPRWLNRLIQRFEVTKKLHPIYQAGFRKGEGTPESLRLYFLFALALTLSYTHDRNLQLLSTLLKVNDLLCSVSQAERRAAALTAAVGLVVATECACVVALARSKGLKIAA